MHTPMDVGGVAQCAACGPAGHAAPVGGAGLQVRMRRSSNGTLISCLLWWLAYGPGRFQMLPATEPTISLLERLGNLLLAHLPVASSLCYQAEILDVVQHAVR